MYKIILALAFILFLSHLYALECVGPSVCVHVNGNCSAYNSQCYGETFCNFVNATYSVCTPFRKVGENCTSDYQCQDHDIEKTTCYNDICQIVAYNAEEGEVCNELHVCKVNLWCNFTNPSGNGTCVKGQSIGQNCTEITCTQGICNYGVCINYFSIPEGGACSQPKFLNFIVTGCAPGLYCNYSWATENGTCAKGFPSSNAPCNNTCANPDEICVCQGNNQHSTCLAPSVTSQSQADNFKSLENCLVNSSCNFLDPSCCSDHKCTVYDIFYQNQDLTSCGGSNPYSSCLKSGGLSTAELIGIIVGAIIVVVVVAGVVVYCVRRKKHTYSKIGN